MEIGPREGHRHDSPPRDRAVEEEVGGAFFSPPASSPKEERRGIRLAQPAQQGGSVDIQEGREEEGPLELRAAGERGGQAPPGLRFFPRAGVHEKGSEEGALEAGDGYDYSVLHGAPVDDLAVGADADEDCRWRLSADRRLKALERARARRAPENLREDAARAAQGFREPRLLEEGGDIVVRPDVETDVHQVAPPLVSIGADDAAGRGGVGA